MNDEQKVLVNITPNETRVAWIENGVLQEIWVERNKKRGLVGNIYLGRIDRVLPGMQAAFIDIGLTRAAFLHVSDVTQALVSARSPDDPEDIGRLLYEGQRVLVQVVKDPLGTKGARVTMQVSIASRLLVYMPDEQNVGVSQKIDSSVERERLREMVKLIPESSPSSGGFIVRTVAENADFHELRADVMFLQQLWKQASHRAVESKKPRLVYEDLPLYLRILRDVPKEGIEKIRVDSAETFQKMKSFAKMYSLEITDKIGHYQGDRPIFDLYNIEDEIQTALEKKVMLKSGGYLIIDQTEAMTTIDVNTGGFVGHKNLEETIYRTNLEATQAIARQLRLRNLGGIIILDLIDMEDDEHKKHVYESLQKALMQDRVKTSISEISRLGLIEMTRKRTRESLERTLCEPCPMCHGRGVVKTAETVGYEIFREITRMDKSFNAERYRVIAAESVVARILDEESDSVAALEAFLGKSIRFQAESSYPPEYFDVVMM
ncbi:ribonuclease G [Thiomicrospira sp. ALE5]|uniref:ribonuclease G n=1 Tax=Thiomicrospira sp. ALE5 TaxID=748650 RepID=UPI0008E04CBF|nr:ribonuclease G [Thiomicrospira sp. ALE5]SFR58515.1 ribonuclease G [Thiomicrospira sp. ALE5]